MLLFKRVEGLNGPLVRARLDQGPDPGELEAAVGGWDFDPLGLELTENAFGLTRRCSGRVGQHQTPRALRRVVFAFDRAQGFDPSQQQVRTLIDVSDVEQSLENFELVLTPT